MMFFTSSCIAHETKSFPICLSKFSFYPSMLTGSLSLSFSRRFYPPCQLFARLSLLRLPHYMRAWNRLPQASLLTHCHDTFSLPQGGFSRTMSSNVANKFKLKRKFLQSYLWLCQETKEDVLADLRDYHLPCTLRRLALSISRDRQASRSVYVNWGLNLFFLKRVLKTKELFLFLYIFLDLFSFLC